MNRIINLIFVALILFSGKIYGQQVARATNVEMVSTAGTKIVIEGGISFIGTSNWLNNGETHLYKTTAPSPEGWLDSTTSGVLAIASTGNVFFRGTNRQSFYGKTRFYDLTIRNSKGDTLLSSCEVRNNLNLDTGYVFTRSGFGMDSLLVSNTAIAAILSTSSFSKSWVHGRLSRTGNVPGSAVIEYLFPIGKIKLPDSLYAPIKLDKFNSNTNTYTAEYFPAIPFDNLNINPPIDHVSKVEYWEISASTPTGPDADAKVALSWRTYSVVSTNAAERNNLLVTQYVANPGFAWWKLGTAGAHTVVGADATFGYVKHNTYLGAFSYPDRRFTLGSSSSTNPLPVKLIYFTAIGDGNKVRLNWEVANEQNTLSYEVQKSLTTSGFNHLSTVNSRQQSQSAYVEHDHNPASGWNYYRLKIVEKSGDISYSPVRAVNFEKGMEDVKLFPIPATDVLNILLPTSFVNKVELQVLGIDGKFISSMKPSTNMLQLNIRALSAGSYIIQLYKSDGTKNSYRFVKY